MFPVAEGEPEDAPIHTAPLTPVGWLLQNGIWLVLLAAGAIFLYRAQGAEGIIRALMVGLGLGFIIFIHELGHFLTAKWCDVHVQTFSIGFGPALPGCSFRRGETTYKIGILPLGGYVNMVGEGPEAEEDDDSPRSFKNKTVGQRMLIISAGVIMNVILGAICFVVVYRFHGVKEPTAIVYRTEAGGPAWKKGVHNEWVVGQINKKENPNFNDLRVAVALSSEGEKVQFVFRKPNQKDPGGSGGAKPSRGPVTEAIALEPRRDKNDMYPVIGVAYPTNMKLLPEVVKSSRAMPVYYHSAAGAARVMDLNPGDIVLRATDPEQDNKLAPGKLPPFQATANRMIAVSTHVVGSALSGQPWSTAGMVLLSDSVHHSLWFRQALLGRSTGVVLAPSGQPWNTAGMVLSTQSLVRRIKAPVAWGTLASRMRELGNQPLKLQVLRAGTDSNRTTRVQGPEQGGAERELPRAQRRRRGSRSEERAQGPELRGAERELTETITVPGEDNGFHWGDQIIATTDPDRPNEPFFLKELPPDPNNDSDPDARDPFAFRRRLYLLAGKPMAVRVRRKDVNEPVTLFVPPAFHYRLGMRMKMGPVSALREGSEAVRSGLQVGDVIYKVWLKYDEGEPTELTFQEMDPVRLPFELSRRVYAQGDPNQWQVQLEVKRIKDHNENNTERLRWMKWDPSWRFDEEIPISPAAAMAIKELGIAYRVESQVTAVEPGSSAAKAGVKPGALVEEIRFRVAGKTVDEEKWDHWAELTSTREDGKEHHDKWPHFFWSLQRHGDFREVQLKVKQDGKTDTITLQAKPDRTWPKMYRGFLFQADTRMQKADTLLEALAFGADRTGRFIKQIYLNLKSLVSGRISHKSLGGPIEIATQAFSVAGENIFVFILFLGIISIQLAVVNFLPIPVLDGGHMVFLIYEKLRGRPPSETVRAIATYVGLAMIVSLMLFVFWLDISRRIWGT